MADFIDKLKKGDVRYITIEIIENGFLVTLPEFCGKENAKFHRLSLEGVKKLMERIWEKEDTIEPISSEKTNETIESIVKKKAKNVKKDNNKI